MVAIEIYRIAPPTAPSLLAILEDLARELEESGDQDLAEAGAKIGQGLADAFWADENTLEAGSGEELFKLLRDAAQRIEMRAGTSSDTASYLETLVEVSRILATDAVAAAGDLSPQKFAKADRELERAEEAAASSDASHAIGEFPKAWKTAS